MKTFQFTSSVKVFAFIVCSIILTFNASDSFSQNYGEIMGRVFDEKTNESLPGAEVVIYRGESLFMGCITDKDGYFTLKPVPVGLHNVTVRFTGYGSKEILKVKVDADKIADVKDIGLVYGEGYDLPTIIIVWNKPIVDPEDPSKNIMDSKILRSIPNSGSLPHLLSIMTTNIIVSENGKDVYFRGARSGDAVYIIDGVKMIHSEAMVPSRAIGSMTVYSGGVPAKYGDFTGGVVIIETMSYFDWLADKKAQQLMQTNL